MPLCQGANRVRDAVAFLVGRPVPAAVFAFPISGLKDYLEDRGLYEHGLVAAFELDNEDEIYLVLDYGEDGWEVHHSTEDGIFDKFWHNRASKAPAATHRWLQCLLSLEETPRFTKQLDELTRTARGEAFHSPPRSVPSKKTRDWIIRRYFSSTRGPLVYHSRQIAPLTEIIVEICVTRTFIQFFQDAKTREIRVEAGKPITSLKF